MKTIKNCFLQIEAIFFARNVTSKKSKFAKLVQALSLSIVDEVEHEPYSRLKETLLKHTDRSDKDLIKQLFNNVTRDNETLSQLLHFMKSRLGKHTMAEPSLRGLWLDCLPSTVKQILAPVSENIPLDQLADSIDNIFAKIDHGVNPLSVPNETQVSSRLLETVVADLQVYSFLYISRS